MKNALFLMAVVAVCAVSTAHAARPYGTAGCGLGSVLMGKSGNQILAATTNGTFYSQTFGITSGTSNCTDAGTVSAQRQMPIFVAANREALANDIARGNGDTLSSLSSVMGCSDSSAVGSTLQRNYQQIFPSESVDSDQVTDSIRSVIRQDNRLARDCRNVG
jgi:hypothetical protein